MGEAPEMASQSKGRVALTLLKKCCSGLELGLQDESCSMLLLLLDKIKGTQILYAAFDPGRFERVEEQR